MSNPFVILGLSQDATEAEVQGRWRELARTLHPDLGGDPAEFHLHEQAYQEARAIAHNRETECPECHGSERKVKFVGVSRLEVPCPRCQS